MTATGMTENGVFFEDLGISFRMVVNGDEMPGDCRMTIIWLGMEDGGAVSEVDEE
jgi:hypothetical protein